MMDEIRRPLQRSVWLACSIAPSVTHSVLSGSTGDQLGAGQQSTTDAE